MSTWTRRPFVSYDGKDENGTRAEVKVLMGYGNVDTITPSTGAGKANKVEFVVENTKYKSSGWAPIDSNVMEKVLEAQKLDVPIYFRIETRRQKNIDRSTPIDELTTLAMAKDSIHKSIAAVRINETDEWTVSPHAVTRIDEDPASGNGVYSANDQSKEELAGAGNSKAVQQANGVEAPPYMTYNRDGGLNPGSMAVAVPLNLLSFVAEQNREGDLGISEKHQAVLVKAMLQAANKLQVEIYEGKLEKPDLSAGSHTRARALVFEVIRSHYPVSKDLLASKETLKEWHDGIFTKSLAMWKWSITEVEAVLAD